MIAGSYQHCRSICLVGWSYYRLNSSKPCHFARASPLLLSTPRFSILCLVGRDISSFTLVSVRPYRRNLVLFLWRVSIGPGSRALTIVLSFLPEFAEGPPTARVLPASSTSGVPLTKRRTLLRIKRKVWRRRIVQWEGIGAFLGRIPSRRHKFQKVTVPLPTSCFPGSSYPH